MEEPIGFDAIIEALTIFRKYDNPASPFHCEHDMLFVYVNPDEFSEEEMSRLDTLGFTRDGEVGDCFVSFRYGSA